MIVRRLIIAGLVGAMCGGTAAAQTDERIAALIAEGDRLSADTVRQTATATEKYREADRLAAGTSDLRLRATARMKLVQGLYYIDALADCVRVGEDAERLARGINALDIVGNVKRSVGACLLGLGRFDEADAAFGGAAELLAVHGTSTQYALALSNRAANARLQGQLGEAIQYSLQAIGVIDRALAAGDELTPRALFAVPFNLGKAMADGGDYVGARPYLERAFAAAERTGDIGGQMHALFDTGEWYESQGDPDRAARYYQRSLDFAAGHQNGEEIQAKSLEGLGRIDLLLGNQAAAIDHLTRAYRLYLASELEMHIPVLLVHLSRAREGLGDRDAAARDLDHAVDLARKRRHAASTVVALTARGRLRTASGSHTGARDDFADAIALARQVRLLPLIPSAAAGRARLSEISGDLTGALTGFEEAADAVDGIRGHILSFELRSSFAAATHDVFSGLVRVLVALHRRHPADGYDRRALLALERERSQALDLETSTARRLSDPGAAEPEGRIARIQSALFAPDLADARRQQLLAELDDAERTVQLAAPTARLQRTGSGAASLDQLQASLGDGEVLLEYAVDESRAMVFVVTRTSLRLVPLAIDRDVAARIAFFIRALEDNAGEAAVGVGRVLAGQLIDPLPIDVASASRLLIVATGPLARLPFAALPLPSPKGVVEPLLARHDVTYLPSLTLFHERRTASTSGPCSRSVMPSRPAARSRSSGDCRRAGMKPGSWRATSRRRS